MSRARALRLLRSNTQPRNYQLSSPPLHRPRLTSTRTHPPALRPWPQPQLIKRIIVRYYCTSAISAHRRSGPSSRTRVPPLISPHVYLCFASFAKAFVFSFGFSEFFFDAFFGAEFSVEPVVDGVVVDWHGGFVRLSCEATL
jgi:hypothetical protein